MYSDQNLLDGLLATMRFSTEPMVLSDPNQADMPIMAVNPAFEALTGYAAAEIVGANCRFLQGKGTDRETVEKMSQCLKQAQGCVQWLVNYRKDGSQFWNLLFISPVFSADGRLLYFFANQHDLSGEIPLDIPQFTLGMAHMPDRQQAEFHSLLAEIGQDGASGMPVDRAGSLESTLLAARQVATLSLRLEAGPMAGA